MVFESVKDTRVSGGALNIFNSEDTTKDMGHDLWIFQLERGWYTFRAGLP